MAAPKDPIQYLIKGWLTAGEVSIFAGPSGSGKSFVVLDMAMCIARAVAFLRRYRVNGGGVVYQAGEGAKGLRDKRIPAYMQKYGLSFQDEIPFALLPRPIDLYGSENHTDALIADIKAVGAEWAQGETDRSSTPPRGDARRRREHRQGRVAGPDPLQPHRPRVRRPGAPRRPHEHRGPQVPAISWQANVDTVMVCKTSRTTRRQQAQVREVELAKQKDGESGILKTFVLPELTIGRDMDGAADPELHGCRARRGRADRD